jgi:hypothetical protein
VWPDSHHRVRAPQPRRAARHGRHPTVVIRAWLPAAGLKVGPKLMPTIASGAQISASDA